jgi:hypothetical protein
MELEKERLKKRQSGGGGKRRRTGDAMAGGEYDDSDDSEFETEGFVSQTAASSAAAVRGRNAQQPAGQRPGFIDNDEYEEDFVVGDDEVEMESDDDELDELDEERDRRILAAKRGEQSAGNGEGPRSAEKRRRVVVSDDEDDE